jgi:hypothetical protein
MSHLDKRNKRTIQIKILLNEFEYEALVKMAREEAMQPATCARTAVVERARDGQAKRSVVRHAA